MFYWRLWYYAAMGIDLNLNKLFKDRPEHGAVERFLNKATPLLAKAIVFLFAI